MLLTLRDFSIPQTVEKIGIPHALSPGCAGLRRATRLGELDARKVDEMKAAVRHQLDPTIRSNDTCDFHSSLRAKIVGQEEGVRAVVDMYQVFCAGMNSPGRPVGNLLFLGPDRLRKDAHRGSDGRDSVWRPPRGDQG